VSARTATNFTPEANPMAASAPKENFTDTSDLPKQWEQVKSRWEKEVLYL
jgi:hypothetical protein